jgi:hypothetical protein
MGPIRDPTSCVGPVQGWWVELVNAGQRSDSAILFRASAWIETCASFDAVLSRSQVCNFVLSLSDSTSLTNRIAAACLSAFLESICGCFMSLAERPSIVASMLRSCSNLVALVAFVGGADGGCACRALDPLVHRSHGGSSFVGSRRSGAGRAAGTLFMARSLGSSWTWSLKASFKVLHFHGHVVAG